MFSKPTIEQLEEETEYEKVLTLPYSDIAPFVIGRLGTPRLPMIIVWSVAAASAFMIVWFWPGLRGNSHGQSVISGLIAGLIGLPLLLVPIHEGLHLLPYRLAGARDIRWGADLRQGIIYVTAHRFVAGLSLFCLVAVTPFLVITSAMVTAMIFSSPWWQWVLSMTVFAHATMCAGDAALLGFMTEFRRRGVYTWDDADTGVASFRAGAATKDNVKHKK